MELAISTERYCQPFKRYTIPRKERRPSEGCQCPVNSNSREARELENDVKRLAWDAFDLDSALHVTRTCKIENPLLEREFHEKRTEMRTDGRSPKELTEQLAFRAETDFVKVSDVCVNGLRCAGENCCLGDATMGVSVWRCPDLCLRSVNWPVTGSVSLVVFKIVKGRVKQVTCISEGPNLEPTPNYDCHISRNTPNPSVTDCNVLMKDTQYYLYEYDDDGLPCERPRQCLPFAVIYLEKSQDSSRSSAVTLEKVLNPAKPTEGGNFPAFEENGGSIAWRGLVTNKQKSIGWVTLMAAHKLSLSIWRSYFDVTEKISLKHLEKLLPGDIITAWNEALVYRGHAFSLCTMKASGPTCESLIKFTKDLSRKVKSAGVVSIDASTTLFLIPSSNLAVRLGFCDTVEPWRMFCVICRRQMGHKSPCWRGKRVTECTSALGLASATDSREQSGDGNDSHTLSFSPKLLAVHSLHRSQIFTAQALDKRKPETIVKRSLSHNSALASKRMMLKERFVGLFKSFRSRKENDPGESTSSEELRVQKEPVNLLSINAEAEYGKIGPERRSSWPVRSNSPIPFLEPQNYIRGLNPSGITTTDSDGCTPSEQCNVDRETDDDVFTDVKDHKTTLEGDTEAWKKIGEDSPIAADNRVDVVAFSAGKEKDDMSDETSHSVLTTDDCSTTALTLSPGSVVADTTVNVPQDMDDSSGVYSGDVNDTKSTNMVLQPPKPSFTGSMSPSPLSVLSMALSPPLCTTSPGQPSRNVKTSQRRIMLPPCSSSNTQEKNDRTVVITWKMSDISSIPVVAKLIPGNSSSPATNDPSKALAEKTKSAAVVSCLTSKQRKLKKERRKSSTSTSRSGSSSVTNEPSDIPEKLRLEERTLYAEANQRKRQKARSESSTYSCETGSSSPVTNEASVTTAKRRSEECTSYMKHKQRKLQKKRSESSTSSCGNGSSPLQVTNEASVTTEKRRPEECTSNMKHKQRKLQKKRSESSTSSCGNGSSPLQVTNEASVTTEKRRPEGCTSYMKHKQRKLQKKRSESSTSSCGNGSSPLQVTNEASVTTEKRRPEGCTSYMKHKQRKLEKVRHESSNSTFGNGSSPVSNEPSGTQEEIISEEDTHNMTVDQKKLQKGRNESTTRGDKNSPVTTEPCDTQGKYASNERTSCLETTQRELKKGRGELTTSISGNMNSVITNGPCDTQEKNASIEGTYCMETLKRKLKKRRRESNTYISGDRELASCDRNSPVTNEPSDLQEKMSSREGASYMKTNQGKLQMPRIKSSTFSSGDWSLPFTENPNDRQGELTSKGRSSNVKTNQKISASEEKSPSITHELSGLREKIRTEQGMKTNHRRLHKATKEPSMPASSPSVANKQAASQRNLNPAEDSAKVESGHEQEEAARTASSHGVPQDTCTVSGKRSDCRRDAVTCIVKGDNIAQDSCGTAIASSSVDVHSLTDGESAQITMSSRERCAVSDASNSSPQKVDHGRPSNTASIGGNTETASISDSHGIPVKKWLFYKNAFRKVFNKRLPTLGTNDKVIGAETDCKRGCFDFEEDRVTSQEMTSETRTGSCKDNIVDSTNHDLGPIEGCGQTVVSSITNSRNDCLEAATSFLATANSVKKPGQIERYSDEISQVQILPTRKPVPVMLPTCGGSLITHSPCNVTQHITPTDYTPSDILDSESDTSHIVTLAVNQKPRENSNCPPTCDSSLVTYSSDDVTPIVAPASDSDTSRTVTRASLGDLNMNNLHEVTGNEVFSPSRLHDVTKKTECFDKETSKSEKRVEEKISTSEASERPFSVKENEQKMSNSRHQQVDGSGEENLLEDGVEIAQLLAVSESDTSQVIWKGKCDERGDESTATDVESFGCKSEVAEQTATDSTKSDSSLSADRYNECTSRLADGKSLHHAEIVEASCENGPHKPAICIVKHGEEIPSSVKVDAVPNESKSVRRPSITRESVMKESTNRRYYRPENEQEQVRPFENAASWMNRKDHFASSVRHHNQGNYNKYDHGYNSNSCATTYGLQSWRKREFLEKTNSSMCAKRFRLEGRDVADIDLRARTRCGESGFYPRASDTFDRQYVPRLTERRPDAYPLGGPVHARQSRCEPFQQQQQQQQQRDFTRSTPLHDYRPPHLSRSGPGERTFVPSLLPSRRPSMSIDPVTAVTWSLPCRQPQFFRESPSR